MEPVDFGGALLRRWWLLLALGLFGLVAGLAAPVSHSRHSSPLTYSATAVVGASPPGVGANGALTGGITSSQITFYARTDQVVEAAAKQVGRAGSVSQLEREITVTADTAKRAANTGTIKLTGTGATPADAAAFTNAFADQLGAYMGNLASQRTQGQLAAAKAKVAQLQSEIAGLGKTTTRASASLQNQLNAALAQEQGLVAASTATGYLVLQPAQANSATKTGGGLSGLGSSRLVRGVAGLLIGLVVAAGIVLVLEMLDKRIRGSSRAEETFGFPVVAEIPIPSKENGAGVVSVFSGASTPTAEAYRMLRMSVLFGAMDQLSRYEEVGNGQRSRGRNQEGALGVQQGDEDAYASEPRRLRSGVRQVIMVVSAGTEATRPLVVTNLAATFADGGQRVLVMSTHDLHASNRVSPRGEDPMAPIPPEVLERSLRPSPLANVSSVPLVPFVANSGQLALRGPSVLEAARHLAEVVLVEAPPLLGFHDAEALAPSVDVVLIVGECMATTFDQAKRAGDLLRRIGAPVIGVALTNMRIGSRDIRRSVEKPQVGPKNNLEPEPAMADIGHASWQQ